MRILSTFYSSCLLTILPLLLLSSCSWDNLNSRNKRKENNSSNTTVVAFELSDKGGASTYALDGDDDSAVSEIHILLFNTRNQLIDATPRLGTLTTINGKVEVKTTLTTLPYGNIVLLANASTILSGVVFTEGMTYSDAMDLLQLNLSDKWNAKKGSGGYMDMPMYGETGYVDVRINNNVFATNLIRMLCRVDVNLTDKALTNFKLTSVRVYNRETRGMLAPSKVAGKPSMPSAPIKEHAPLVYDNKNDKTEIAADSMSTQGEIFLMESLIANELDDKARLADALCLVVGGIYDGEECFYRVDFAMDDTTGEDAPYPKHFYNPLRNHHYQINITAVLGAGEEKPDEAFKKETALIKVDVLDWGKGGAIDGDVDGEHVLRLSQGEFNLPTPAHTAGSVGNKLTVSSTHPEGWYIEKITKEDGTTTSDWLSVDLLNSGTPQMIGKTFSLILSENDEAAARVGYIFIKSGSRMVYKVKVTQLPKVRIRSIAWSDYDDDGELTHISVEQEGGTVQVTDIDKATNTFSPIEIESTIAKVKLLYMDYWLDVPASKWSISEDGTKITVTDRSLIGKPIHLDKIRLDLTGNYLQVGHVDLAGYTSTAPGGAMDNWVPIGIKTPVEAQFSGSYDGGSDYGGKRFTISNLNIARVRWSNYTGLFGYASATSVLTKIHIATGSINGGTYVGAVCGLSEGSISNSSNESTVEATGTTGSFVGGIAGQGATINNCTNNATITGAGNYVGGIAGKHEGATDVGVCTNAGNVIGNHYVGGLFGDSYAIIGVGNTSTGTVKGVSFAGNICGENNGKISGIINNTPITATGYGIGGIVGRNWATVGDCTNTASVSGTGADRPSSDVGGICGISYGTSVMYNCHNTATISGEGGTYVGGIAGSYQGTTNVGVCTNTATIIGGSYVGGLFGGSSAIIGVGNTSTGTVKGVSFAGNICGGNNGTISNITNNTPITGTGMSIGGIAGTNRGTISRCKNNATVEGTGTVETTGSNSLYVGGVCGYNNGTIEDCSNYSDVIGWGEVGGICGYDQIGGDVGVCTNTGNITGNNDVGGLFGSSFATIGAGNTSTGTVTGVSQVGNICGVSLGTISGIINNTPIAATGSKVGGIAGTNGGTIIGCINNATVAGTGTGAMSSFVGGICGNSVGPKSDITDCENKGAVIGTESYVGGIVGSSTAGNIVSGCKNYAPVSGTSTVSHYIGGVVGDNNTSIVRSCTNNNAVTSEGKYIGGIAGYTIGSTSSVTNSHNESGTIIGGANSEYVGGVVGYSGKGTISDCTNKVPVTGVSYIGGICGSSTGTIDGCHNTVVVTGESSVGGIAGEGSIIKDCTNNATIKGKWDFIGGICGDQYGTLDPTIIISNCQNLVDGIVDGASANFVGGIAGRSSMAISNCSNAAPITASQFSGGICGDGSAGKIQYCINTGAVESKHIEYSYAGGIAAQSEEILNCINKGAVIGKDRIGGIVATGKSKAIACYNLGVVTPGLASGPIFGIFESEGYTPSADDCFFGSDVGNFLDTPGSTKFSDTAWPNKPSAMTGWETTTWNIGAWNTGGASTVYPTLKP